MDYSLIKSSIFYIMVPMLFVALFTPIVKLIAVHVNAIDIPNDRKIHKKPIPRLGGLAIVGGFLLGYMLFCTPSNLMNSILIGAFIIFITCMIDDMNPIPAKIKLLCQLLAVCVVTFYGGLYLSYVTVFGYLIDFKWCTVP